MKSVFQPFCVVTDAYNEGSCVYCKVVVSKVLYPFTTYSTSSF